MADRAGSMIGLSQCGPFSSFLRTVAFFAALFIIFKVNKFACAAFQAMVTYPATGINGVFHMYLVGKEGARTSWFAKDVLMEQSLLLFICIQSRPA
jgi:hypothetical protein